MTSAPSSRDHERLTRYLRALASPIRLQLLEALQEPSRAADVRLPATTDRGGFSAGRILSRPAIVQHLDVLEELALVRRVGEGYVVDQQTMFSILEDLGGLARLKPVVEVDVVKTRATPAAAPAPEFPKPRLVVVGGPREGRAFRLAGDGPWRIGRAPECEVRLEYDPHVSRLHVAIHRSERGFFVAPEPGVTNPLLLDFAIPGPPPSLVPPGTILSVGASRLVLQA